MLEIVAEQTGYPPDLLDMDLDLEADLGIDTVKQAEVFATIREAYGIERDDALKLRDYPTLNHVVGVRQRALRRGAEPPPRRSRAEPAPRGAPSAEARAVRPRRRRRRTMCRARVLGDRRRADGLSDGPARHGSGSRGRSGDRHGQAGGGVRHDPEAYGIERDDTLKLRDYPTLNHVVGVRQRALRPRPAPAAAPSRPRPSPRRAGARPSRPGACDGFPRRVPVPWSCGRRSTAACRPASSSARAARVVAHARPRRRRRGAGRAARQARRRGARDRGHARPSRSSRARSRLAEGRARSTASTGCRRSTTRAPRRARPRRLARGPARARQAAGRHDARAASADDGTFLVAATRLGGRHGYDAAGATSVMGGAVTGFTKALARERERRADQGGRLRAQRQDGRARRHPDRGDPARPRRGRDRPRRRSALDGRPRRAPRAGHDPDARCRPRTPLSSSPAPPAASSRRSPPTWPRGARRRPSTCSTSSPSPTRTTPTSSASSPTATASSASSPSGSRRPASGPRPSSSSASWRASSARARRSDAIEAIEARRRHRASGTRSTSPTPQQVADAARRRCATSGRVDVLLHCAGLEISHFLPDKPQREYDLVFDVKANGWFNLLRRAPRTPTSTPPSRSARSPGGSATAARPTTARPTTCCARASSRICAATGATRGIAIDWTAWARDRHGDAAARSRR